VSSVLCSLISSSYSRHLPPSKPPSLAIYLETRLWGCERARAGLREKDSSEVGTACYYWCE
jgi:hypothetical protein